MRKLLLLAGVSALVGVACGGPRAQNVAVGTGADLGAVPAVPVASPGGLITGGNVEVAVVDFGYRPSSFTVKAGSTVTFSFVNRGSIAHEALIGSLAQQLEHEAEMAQPAGGSESMDGSMSMGSSEAPSGPEAPVLEVQPGETATLTYTFSNPGRVLIGCHVPGHWAAGMRAIVTVV